MAALLAVAAGLEIGGCLMGGVHVVDCLAFRSVSSVPTAGQASSGTRGFGRKVSPITSERHDHITVAVVGGADGSCVAVLQVNRKTFFGFEDFQEIVDEAGVECDCD